MNILSTFPGPAPSSCSSVSSLCQPSPRAQAEGCACTWKGKDAQLSLVCVLLWLHIWHLNQRKQLCRRFAETTWCLYETCLLSSSRPTNPSHVQSSISIITQYYYHLIKIFLPQFSLKMIINYLFVAITLCAWCYWCGIYLILLSVTIMSYYDHLK